MKKALKILLAVALISTLALALTACSPCRRGDHAWDEGLVTTPATCEQEGEMTYTCTVCGQSKTEKVDKIDHAWDRQVSASEPTCVESGNTAYSHCGVCDKYFDAQGNEIAEGSWSIGATGKHIWDEGKVTKEASCTEQGSTLYTCTKCNATKTEPIAKTAHAWDSQVSAKEPTCNEGGNIAYSHCKDCNKYYDEDGEELAQDEWLLDATDNHDWDSGRIEKEPSCSEEGTKVFTCNTCRTTKEESVDKIAHTWGDWTTETSATCTVKGTEKRTCDKCLTDDTRSTDALGHDYDGQSWTHDDSDAFGVHHMECTRGDAEGKKTESCTIGQNEGVKNSCATCGATYTETQIVDALFDLASGKSLNGEFVLTGVVTKIVTEYSDKYFNITVDMLVDGRTVRAYRLEDAAAAGVSVKDISVGATITVCGELTNYSGTREFVEGCQLLDMTRAQYRVVVEIDPEGQGSVVATDGNELQETYEGGVEIAFRVRVSEGYKLLEVQINGEAIKADGGVYSFTVAGETTITVKLVTEDTVVPEVVASLTFGSTVGSNDGNSDGYNGSWDATRNGFTWTLNHFNNNNKYGGNWTYVRTGSKSSALTATIDTKTAMVDAIIKVVVNVTKLSEETKVKSFKLIVSKTNSFTGDDIVQEIEMPIAVGEVEFVISSPQSGYYYRLVVDCEATSNNGIVEITSVDYYANVCSHKWQIDESKGNQGWTWDVANGQSSATLALKCSKCEQTREETVEATYTETLAPECEVQGAGEYEATVTLDNGQSWSNTLEVSVSATGHHYKSEWVLDDPEGHYHECIDCGKADEVSKHIFSEIADLGDTHWSYCDICLYELDEAHNWSTPIRVDDNSHKFVCTTVGCSGEKVESHSFETGDCACGEKQGHVHDWDEERWTTDQFGHWRACKSDDCSAKKDYEEHKSLWEVKDDGHHEVCEVCTYEMTQKQAHVYSDYQEDYEYNAIDGSHYTFCMVCFEDFTHDTQFTLIDEKDHKMSCNVAGCKYEEIDEHTYDQDGELCRCGAEKPKEKVVAIDFVANFSVYAKSWQSSYSNHTLTPTDLGVTNLDFSLTINASKQSGTITDRPVSKTKALTLSVTDVSITKVKLEFAQWSNKALGTMTLTITLSDGTTKKITGNANLIQEFDLSEYQGVKQIELSNGSTSNQAGFTGIELTVVED